MHILDLHEDGYIKPHVDAVRFCGNTIAGNKDFKKLPLIINKNYL